MDGDESKSSEGMTQADMEARIAQMEQDFGQKRAKFMELFKQKEESLAKCQGELAEVKRDNDNMAAELVNLRSEMEGVKTAAAISEGSKQDEIADIQRHCREEMASLQRIMTENITSTRLAASEKYEQEKARWLKNQEKLESEITELKSKLSQEREGFLANMAKTLHKKVATTVGNSSASEAETLEDDMKKAERDAEMMRSLVLPLEDEIRSLKSKLADTMDKLRRGRSNDKAEGESSNTGSELEASGSKHSLEGSMDMEDKVKELHQHLENEKSSRTDLEMYVAVLKTQKTVLEDEADKLRSEIKEVCGILEEERRECADLKRTWQMANDQFLEAQRLMMMDMRRMEAVLTSEQQRQITDLKKKDADREAQERRVRELEQMREEEERKRNEVKATSPGGGSQTSLLSTDAMMKLDDELSSAVPRSHSQHSLTSPDLSDHTESRVQLTELQHKSLTDPTPENAASEKLVSSAKLRSLEPMSTVGKRLVSDKEWHMLQQEMKAAREKLGRPCSMCQNYEAQLQECQELKKRADGQLRTLERQLDGERQAHKNHEQYTKELEQKLKEYTEDAEDQISELSSKVEESERFLQGIQAQYTHMQSELSDQLNSLTADREKVQKELIRLQKDNDSLVGKHSKHSQQLQEECINLPDTMEEMQLLLLRYREEIIEAKVGQEHAEDTKRSEILFLKDQVRAEQQERNTVEETLSQEVTALQEELAILQSVRSELERETHVRSEAESRARELEQQLRSAQAQHKQLVTALQGQVEESGRARSDLEHQVHELQNKVASLQKDLEDGEAVQRDFVKLSQTLQMQLEQIRAAEQEVRWQHDEDVDECNNCKQTFTGPRKKNHCRHCGRIFCGDCLPKSVASGPRRRAARVCGVCHTILVSDSAPYFSTDPPQHTPD